MNRALLFAVLLAWCGVLIAFRRVHAQDTTYDFLVWNLFLAVIPAIAAAAFERLNARGGPALMQVAAAMIWIVFLPNAPYIATDFIHLAPSPRIPLWYDIATLVTCAATGLLLGYSSVADVQMVVARRWNRGAGWLTSAAVLVLSAFGIYLGRFVRWNSWDAIAQPAVVAGFMARHAAMDPLAHERSAGVTLVYGSGLVLGYFALRVFGAAFERRDPARRVRP